MMTTRLKFSEAIDKWESLNFSKVQKQLDQKSLQILENQKSQPLGKQKLVKATRDFKLHQGGQKSGATTDNQLPEDLSNLLKLYQVEIDQLQRQCKFAETCFLTLYQTLAELPDPYPYLKSALEYTIELGDLKEKFEKLQRDNKNFERAAEEDEEDVQYDASTGTIAFSGKTSKQLMLEEQFEERRKQLEADFKTQQRELESKLSKERENLQAEKREFVQANEALKKQLEELERELCSKSSEVSLLFSNVQQSNMEIARLEQTNKLLSAELEKVRNASSSSSNNNGSSSSNELKESDFSWLQKQLKTRQDHIDLLQDQLRAANEEQKQQIALTEEKERQLKDLRQSFEKFMSEFLIVKDELEAFKQVELGNNSSSNPKGDSGPNRDRNLNAELVRKNRSLNSQLTELRMSLNDHSTRLERLQSQYVKSQEDLGASQALCKNLEEDLAKIKVKDSAEMNASTGELPSMNSNTNSLLPIIASQRDRFRARCVEMEKQIRGMASRISSLQYENDNLRNASDREDSSNQTGSLSLPFAINNNNLSNRRLNSPTIPVLIRKLLSSQLGSRILMFYGSALHLLLFLVIYRLNT